MTLPLKSRVQAAIKLNDIANELVAVVEKAESHLGVYDALTADEKLAMIAVLTTAEKNELVAWFGLVRTFATTARTTAPTFLPPPAPPGG
jgi:hypothetical protein